MFTVKIRNTMPAAIAQLRAKAPAAIARAVNRAATSARTAMVPPMAQDLGLKAGVVKDGVHVYTAYPDKPVARLAASLKRLPLYAFGARGPRGKKKTGGVTVRGKRYPNAFIASMKSGHVGVFRREGPSRSRAGKPAHSPGLPIIELHGASLGHVFNKFRERGRISALESLAKNLQAEFRFALRSK